MITIENFKCYSLFWRTINQEIKDILTAGALMIHLGTVDEKGHANIHPAWYYYDSSTDKLYIQTGKQSKKTYNVRNNEIMIKTLHTKGCVEKQAWRYIPIAEKILIKYLGNLQQHPSAQTLLAAQKRGQLAILELSPIYYSAWDNAKQMGQTNIQI